jgi:hypothetical protein
MKKMAKNPLKTMRKNHLFIASILMTMSFSLFAQSTPTSVNNSLTDSLQVKRLYKLITHGQEGEIKKYFNEVSLDELIKSDTGTIVKAINRLSTKDKVTHTIWILEEIKNRNFDLRNYIYTELGKVDFNKPNFMTRQLINNYFTNYIEKEVTLTEKVDALQKKMNR